MSDSEEKRERERQLVALNERLVLAPLGWSLPLTMILVITLVELKVIRFTGSIGLQVFVFILCFLCWIFAFMALELLIFRPWRRRKEKELDDLYKIWKEPCEQDRQ
ncbi:MAG TPA: hypothetical protein VGA49_02330, partial [Patescibacteria group bacterium]